MWRPEALVAETLEFLLVGCTNIPLKDVVPIMWKEASQTLSAAGVC
jgi:hypothetical protein